MLSDLQDPTKTGTHSGLGSSCGGRAEKCFDSSSAPIPDLLAPVAGREVPEELHFGWACNLIGVCMRKEKVGTSLYGGQRSRNGGEVETSSQDMTGTPHDLKCGIAKKAIGRCRSKFRSSTQLPPRLAQSNGCSHHFDVRGSQRKGAEYSLWAASARIVDMLRTTGHGFMGFESSRGIASEFLRWSKLGAEFLRRGFKLCPRRALEIH